MTARSRPGCWLGDVRRSGMDADRNVTVDLGEMRDFADSLVKSGRYGSLEDVVQDAMLALAEAIQDHERWENDPATIEWMRAKVKESLDDPRPDIPAEEVFAKLERKHAERVRAAADRAT